MEDDPQEPKETRTPLGVNAEGVRYSEIEDPTCFDIGFSPQFPDGLVFYFFSQEGKPPAAIVWTGEALSQLLTKLLQVLILSGTLTEISEGELEEGTHTGKKKTPTLH